MSKSTAIKLIPVVFSVMFFTVSCGGGKKTPAGTSGDVIGTDMSIEKKSTQQVISLSDSVLTHRAADTIDMGRMKTGEVVVRKVSIRNAGEKPLVLVSVDKSCGCVETTYPKTPMKPGETGEMDIVFDSQGLTGWVYKTIGVHTSLDQKPYVLVITADVN